MAASSNDQPDQSNPYSYDHRLVAGKLPSALLGELLTLLPSEGPDLLLGPGIGEDAAVIDFIPDSDALLVAKSDPITFATDAIGHYAVNVCANDLAVTGASPRFYLPTLLLPVGTDESVVHAIFEQVGKACAQLDIIVAGGHSEVTPTVSQPVIVGTLLGSVARNGVIASSGCRPDDAILMAGTVPVEGASIIAREKRAELLDAGWQPETIDTAADYLYIPGISVLIPAHAATATGCVHAMHDPTEGGIVGGLRELAHAAGIGLEIDLDAIEILPTAGALCAAFDLDPLGTIASGALLASCAQTDVPTLLAAWQAVGWSGAVIGHATESGGALVARRGGQSVSFPHFHADEITKLWN